jgi:hypothetical protein
MTALGRDEMRSRRTSVSKNACLVFVFPRCERPARNRSVLFSSIDESSFHTLTLYFIHETLPVKKKGAFFEEMGCRDELDCARRFLTKRGPSRILPKNLIEGLENSGILELRNESVNSLMPQFVFWQ